MRRLNAWTLTASLLTLGAAACRPNPQCYSSSECGEMQMCAAGACVALDAGVQGMLEPTWHEVIFPIIQQRCWGDGNCHVRPLDPGIPMALEVYADSQQPSRQGNLVYQEMANRVLSLQSPMPPRTHSQLRAEQITFFTRWSELGAPVGDPMRAPDGGVNTGTVDAGVTNSGPLATAGTPVEIANGYFDLRSPVWGNASRRLVMSDRAQDSLFSMIPPAPPQVILRPSDEAVGLGSDAQGRLLMTQYGSRRVSRVDGVAVTPLSDNYMNLDYNSPHDIVGRADGNVYFTDPGFGLGVRPRGVTFNGVFRLPADESGPVAEYQGPSGAGPAGLELSPDESLLYVTDRTGNLVRRFEIGFDGALANETIFVPVTYASPDGITVDSLGNLYVATELGVQGFDPMGGELGLISLPAEATGVTFGGADLRTLYVTTRTALYAVAMQVTGVNR